MNCLTPLSNIGRDAVCKNELCESDHTEIFWCENCKSFFCAVHKDHNCKQERLFAPPQPEGLAPIAERFCKVCKEEIQPYDFQARLIHMTLADGRKFSFYRCGSCETEIQKTRGQTVIAERKKKARKAS